MQQTKWMKKAIFLIVLKNSTAALSGEMLRMEQGAVSCPLNPGISALPTASGPRQTGAGKDQPRRQHARRCATAAGSPDGRSRTNAAKLKLHGVCEGGPLFSGNT